MSKEPELEHHVLADLAARLAKAERALEEAERVVKPFRALAAAVFREGMNSSRKDDVSLWGFDGVTITYGHLRAARKWMEERHD